MEHAEEVTGALERTGELRVDVGEREEVVVGAGLLALEAAEAGDEAGLVEELAAWGRREQRVAAAAEVLGGIDRLGRILDVGDHVGQVGLERRLDLGRR